MKSNLNEIYNDIIEELKASEGFSIDEVLDRKIMPRLRLEERVLKSQMLRQLIRGAFTSMLNADEIYSYEKGKFVYIENADERQAKHFLDKAKKDLTAVDRRRAKTEERLYQISMAWDENGNFIGFKIPEAMNL